MPFASGDAHSATHQIRTHYPSVILTKLDVSDRTQAAVIAIQHGLGSG
jgi:DNA-binding NarL/FixJ family response regulator